MPNITPTFTNLVDEYRTGPRLAHYSASLRCSSQPGLQSDMRIPHLAVICLRQRPQLSLQPRHLWLHCESTPAISTPLRCRAAKSRDCLRQHELAAYTGSSACSASIYAAIPGLAGCKATVVCLTTPARRSQQSSLGMPPTPGHRATDPVGMTST